ncbi:putative alpha-mannosyltransferase, nucleotide-diphospho-sugar transferase [Plasmopara halstedii]
MSLRSKRWFGRLAHFVVAFFVLYCIFAIIIWIRWAKMDDNIVLFQNLDRRLGIEVESLKFSVQRQAWTKHDFKCLGWVETNDSGDELGTRRECWQRIQAGDAGYCLVMNATSGHVYQIMQTTSLSLKDDTRFTCELANAFSSFRFHAKTYRHDPPMALDFFSPDGIVMAVYEGVLPSAFASIHRLRDVGCILPIEIWFRHEELHLENPVLLLLIKTYGPIYVRQIFDERIYGFNVKVHALYYSHFTRVLLLDADNFALRDPTPLFASEAMKKYGAIFWPDFWHPGNSIFNLHAQSLVWELLDIEYVDMLEQESGQLLVDRARSRPMLDQLMFYATHKPNLFTKLKLVWGDKDLFRLSWLQLRKPFHYNDRRMPGTLGVVNIDRQRYCGVTMVQYDLSGENMLFWHRNTIKISGRQVWHMLQELPLHAKDRNLLPRIQSFNGGKVFSETSGFELMRYEMNALVHTKRVNELSINYASLEKTLITYAQQAYTLLHDQISDVFLHNT